MSVAINHYLAPLRTYLAMDGVNELCINRPGEIFIEKGGAFERFDDDNLNEKHLLGLVDLIAEYNGKNLSTKKPMLSATLPSGERCQFVLAPGVEHGQLGMSIRAPSLLDLSIDDWVKKGAFRFVGKNNAKREEVQKSLVNAKREKDWGAFITLCMQHKKNLIICGGTSSAKTTFLNSCLKLIPLTERLITIEGVREVKVPHENALHLVANEDDASGQSISMLDLLKASLRLRPDRLFLSELRGHEAYPFLRASISGHPGSITTLHADTIIHAKEQLSFMLAESKELQNASETRLKSIIDSSVDVIIQMEKVNGERIINDVYLKQG